MRQMISGYIGANAPRIDSRISGPLGAPAFLFAPCGASPFGASPLVGNGAILPLHEDLEFSRGEKRATRLLAGARPAGASLAKPVNGRSTQRAAMAEAIAAYQPPMGGSVNIGLTVPSLGEMPPMGREVFAPRIPMEGIEGPKGIPVAPRIGTSIPALRSMAVALDAALGAASVVPPGTDLKAPITLSTPAPQGPKIVVKATLRGKVLRTILRATDATEETVKATILRAKELVLAKVAKAINAMGIASMALARRRAAEQARNTRKACAMASREKALTEVRDAKTLSATWAAALDRALLRHQGALALVDRFAEGCKSLGVALSLPGQVRSTVEGAARAVAVCQSAYDRAEQALSRAYDRVRFANSLILA